MSEEIQPALTAEQWRDFLDAGILNTEDFFGMDYVDGDIEVSVKGAADIVPNRGRHALATLCLHDQPFGFTSADVTGELEVAQILRAVVDFLAADNDFDPPYNLREMGAQRIIALAWLCEKRAKRIEALLPPDAE